MPGCQTNEGAEANGSHRTLTYALREAMLALQLSTLMQTQVLQYAIRVSDQCGIAAVKQ